MSIAPFDDGKRSISGLARLLGHDRRTISRVIAENRIEPAGRANGHDTYNIGAVARAMYSPAGGADGEMTPKERLDHWRAENERIKHERETGKLLSAAEVHLDVVRNLLRPMVTMLETLPDLIERRAGLNQEQFAVLCQLIDTERERLYSELIARNGGNDDEEPENEAP